jgi:hypothetical protein
MMIVTHLGVAARCNGGCCWSSLARLLMKSGSDSGWFWVERVYPQALNCVELVKR